MDDNGQIRDREAYIDSVALLEALLRASQLVRIHQNDWLGQFELNDGRFGVLSALSHAKSRGLSQADLAETLCQSASNVSTLIERMARDGLVIRIQSETDRRKRMWSISSQGQARFESVEAKRSAWAARLFTEMGELEQQTLITLLQKCGSSEGACVTLPKSNAAVSIASIEVHRCPDPASDPRSPQFALRQMLLALSSSADVEFCDESEAA